MVNTRTDADLSAAVQNALQTLFPQIRKEIREEFRTGSRSLAVYKFEGNALAWWKAYKLAKGGDVWLITNALQTLLPQIREEIREEFRTGSGSSNVGGNPTPVTIHTWLERFNKQKPHSFEKATAPVDAENWISHMEKIFDTSTETSTEFMQRFLRLAGFLRAAAGTEEEQAKNFQWGLR
nr:zinc finger, CCHC-type, retrotransposon Gag domain protein [Tanacetum cinerariifolium]